MFNLIFLYIMYKYTFLFLGKKTGGINMYTLS